MKRSLPRVREMRRREFIQLAVVAAVAFAGYGCSSSSDTAVASDQPQGLPVGLSSLGGAPDTPQGRTIAAFVDTVVPSAQRDPTGAPGALDVNAAALFFDPTLPVAQFVGILVIVLDGLSTQDFDGKRFTEITPEQREQILEKVLQGDSPVEFAVQLAKLAYFSTDGAGKHLGYPGPNQGYVHDADFSFGRPMSKEITTDGNLP